MLDISHLRNPVTRALNAACDAIEVEDSAALDPLSFYDFVRDAWHIIEPNTRFVDGWHIGAIVEFLEAITKGEIQNGIINIPPRCMKSTLVSVLWQPWVWTFDPGSRWIFGSYDQALSTRDTVKARRVVRSQWYRERWGSLFRLESDQNLKSRFENTRTGVRIAVAVEGRGTGEGGNYIVADDPHKAKDAYSQAALENAHTWWTGTMATRSDDPQLHRRLIIMQRLADNDLTGKMLETGTYTHLCLPMSYNPKIFDMLPTCKRIADPRVEEGEPLWPARFDETAVKDLRVQLGPQQSAAQLDQLPRPLGGSIVSPDWIRRWKAPRPAMHPSEIIELLKIREVQIHVDGRFKEDPLKGSYVCIAAWGEARGAAFLLDMFHEKVGYVATRAALRSMTLRWPMARAKYIEAKASGAMLADDLKEIIPGMILYEPGTVSKIERFEGVSKYFEAGNVYLPDDSYAPWVKIAVSEITGFPRTPNDDIVDTTSQALMCLLDSSTTYQRMKKAMDADANRNPNR